MELKSMPSKVSDRAKEKLDAIDNDPGVPANLKQTFKEKALDQMVRRNEDITEDVP